MTDVLVIKILPNELDMDHDGSLLEHKWNYDN